MPVPVSITNPGGLGLAAYQLQELPTVGPFARKVVSHASIPAVPCDVATVCSLYAARTSSFSNVLTTMRLAHPCIARIGAAWQVTPWPLAWPSAQPASLSGSARRPCAAAAWTSRIRAAEC